MSMCQLDTILSPSECFNQEIKPLVREITFDCQQSKASRPGTSDMEMKGYIFYQFSKIFGVFQLVASGIYCGYWLQHGRDSSDERGKKEHPD